MVRFYLLSIISICFSGVLIAQPGTEVYLLDLEFINGSYQVSNPKSISQDNPGYDNQPSFSPDGQYLYYVATRNNQTDIVSVNIFSETRNWISDTPESGEYSPQLSPDKKYISAVQLENSGRQLLWKYSTESESDQVLIENAKIGYYSWVNNQQLVAFVLGEPNTLQIFNLSKNTSKTVTENIGRSIHLIPKSNKISFISKKDKEWMILSLNPKNGKTKPITCSLTDSEDMAWTAEKRILMGKEGKLFFKNPKKDKLWKEIKTFSALNFKGITRLAVSTDGKKLAIVVSEK